MRRILAGFPIWAAIIIMKRVKLYGYGFLSGEKPDNTILLESSQ